MSKALLVLTGLGANRRGHASIRRWASDLPLDVHVPHYHKRKGLDATAASLARYIETHRLADVDRLCVFCYVLGGWTLNLHLREHPLPNLTHVVYDRSPFQERLARSFVERFPLLGRLRFGRLLREFAETPYPPLDPRGRKIGLLIENRATRLARRLVRERDLCTAPETFGQSHDDFAHVFLDHDEMYRRFDVVGSDLAHFFEHGCFTAGARRQPFDADPFQD